MQNQTDHVVAIEALFAERLFRPVSDPDQDLFESGMLDSVGLIDLLLLLEQDFGLHISLVSLDLDHVRTVRKIAGLVQTSTAQ